MTSWLGQMQSLFVAGSVVWQTILNVDCHRNEKFHLPVKTGNFTFQYKYSRRQVMTTGVNLRSLPNHQLSLIGLSVRMETSCQKGTWK